MIKKSKLSCLENLRVVGGGGGVEEVDGRWEKRGREAGFPRWREAA